MKIRDYVTIHEQRKKKILEFVDKSGLSTKEIAEKLDLSRDTTLRYLHGLKKSGSIAYKVQNFSYIWMKR